MTHALLNAIYVYPGLHGRGGVGMPQTVIVRVRAADSGHNIFELLTDGLTPTTTGLYMAVISTNRDGTADMLYCFADGFGKEVSRFKSSYKDKQAADNALDELMKQHPYKERPVIIIDDVMSVAYCDPA